MFGALLYNLRDLIVLRLKHVHTALMVLYVYTIPVQTVDRLVRSYGSLPLGARQTSVSTLGPNCMHIRNSHLKIKTKIYKIVNQCKTDN